MVKPAKPSVPDYLQALGQPQWITCDIRTFDMSVLGKFGVIMADPPWEIHQDLPYGTMADDEMRKMNIKVLQDDGVIFLWVTGACVRACVCIAAACLSPDMTAEEYCPHCCTWSCTAQSPHCIAAGVQTSCSTSFYSVCRQACGGSACYTAAHSVLSMDLGKFGALSRASNGVGARVFAVVGLQASG